MFINIPGVILDGSTPISAIPARTDIVVYQGVDLTLQVTVTGSNGAAINITGYAGTLKIKDKIPNQAPATVVKTYTATLTAPLTGIMQFAVPGSDLTALLTQSYWWDVFTLNGSSKRDEVVPSGLMTVNIAVGA